MSDGENILSEKRNSWKKEIRRKDLDNLFLKRRREVDIIGLNCGEVPYGD